MLSLALLRNIFNNLHREIYIWIAALLFLAIAGPGSGEHFSFCILNVLDFHFCPGCGIGRSIAHLLRGNVVQSFEQHYLGIFALIIIIHRIYSLFNKSLQHAKSTATPA